MRAEARGQTPRTEREQRRKQCDWKDKTAIIVGAGQSPGEGMGNGRATALLFAREGAKVLAVDHRLESAQGDGRTW